MNASSDSSSKETKSVDSYHHRMTAREKISNIRANAKLINYKKKKHTKHKSTFELYKSVWNRIDKLKANCESNARLSPLEIMQYRQPKFQALLTDLLINGFHRTYSFLFNINEKREKIRKLEGPDSTRWKLTTLADHPNIKKICDYLCKIEMTKHDPDQTVNLVNINELINIFSENWEDHWIIDEMVEIELKCIELVDSSFENRYIKAFGYLTAGINALTNGELAHSVDLLLQVYDSCYSTDWLYSDGKPMIITASKYLCIAYMKLSCKFVTANKVKETHYLTLAREISRDLQMKEIEMVCCMNLGILMEHEKRFDEAIDYFKQLIEISKSRRDIMKWGLACERIATCYKKNSNKTEMFKYLMEFVEVAEYSCNWNEYVRAKCVLGNAYNRRLDFKNAMSAFHEAYFTAWCLKNECATLKALILYRTSDINSGIIHYDYIISNNKRQGHELLIHLKESNQIITSSVLKQTKVEYEYDTFLSRRDRIHPQTSLENI